MSQTRECPKRFLFSTVLAAALLTAGMLTTACNANTPAATTRPAAEMSATPKQTQCPVMTGNAIDPNIYTDYKGKRVYFCCETCKAAFAADPGAYLANLPQFAGAVDGGDEYHGAALHEVAEIFGIITLGFLVVTVFLSVFRRLAPKPMLWWHKFFGVCTLISGLIHGTLMLVL